MLFFFVCVSAPKLHFQTSVLLVSAQLFKTNSIVLIVHKNTAIFCRTSIHFFAKNMSIVDSMNTKRPNKSLTNEFVNLFFGILGPGLVIVVV